MANIFGCMALSSFQSFTASPRLCLVFLVCYVLCALIVLVEAEIFDELCMVLPGNLEHRNEAQQIPRMDRFHVRSSFSKIQNNATKFYPHKRGLIYIC